MNKKMDKRREFDNILEECLERVMKGEDIMTVLALYPEYAEELEPLLKTALDTRNAAAITPRPDFRRRAALEFQQAIREMPVKAKAAPGAFNWRSAWLAPMAVLFLIIVAGTGTLAAASQSLPDSPLYRVKLATESMQLALTPSSLGKTELYAKFNDKRVAEIVAMAEKGDAGRIEKLTADLSGNMLAMADLTGGAPKDASGDMNMLMEVASMPPDQNGEEFATLAQPTITPAPATTVPSTTSPPQTTVAPTTTVTTTRTTADVPETAPPPGTTVVTIPPDAPGDSRSLLREDEISGLSGKEEELQKLLSDKQIEALDALYDALERAPEWLKPRIQAAIDVILSGYSVSISNLSR